KLKRNPFSLLPNLHNSCIHERLIGCLEEIKSVWGCLILLLSRAIVVGLLYPFLNCFGYSLDWKEAIVLVWSGLRGPVALSLPLSLKGHLMDFTKYEMMSKALEAFGDLVDGEELGPADWPTVKKYTRCLHDAGECNYPHTALENVECMHLADIRIQFLHGVQAAYWVMLEEGRINQYAANILIQSIDGALDLVSAEPLCDWNGLKSDVQFPKSSQVSANMHIFPKACDLHLSAKLKQGLGSTTRECSSLMSWPERHSTKSRLHLEHPSKIDQHRNNFSARAMQLSLYGKHGKPPKKPSLRVSRSYTGVSPTESRRLISVKSEGPYTVRKNVNVGEISESLIAPRENSGIIDTSEMDYSSDESGA
nr:putative plasma membrane Na(+) /H(+) antiporter [Tanacetum cinerariifolium]